MIRNDFTTLQTENLDRIVRRVASKTDEFTTEDIRDRVEEFLEKNPDAKNQRINLVTLTENFVPSLRHFENGHPQYLERYGRSVFETEPRNGKNFELGQAARFLGGMLRFAGDDMAYEIRGISSEGDVKVHGVYVTKQNLHEILIELRDSKEAPSGTCNFYLCSNPVSVTSEPFVASRATRDADIQRRKIVLIDIDPIRSCGDSKCPSNNEEHEAALECASSIIQTLKLKKNNYFCNSSGNGAFLGIAVDLENTPETCRLIHSFQNIIKRLAEKEFPTVEIDTNVDNASRGIKIPGTLAIKGDESESRPYRLAHCYHYPIQGFSPFDLTAIVDQEEIVAKPEKTCSGHTDSRNPVNGRVLPEIDDWAQYRIKKWSGEGCSICGNNKGQCLEGTTPEGHEWGLCWRYECWGNIGEEGRDWIRFETFGSQGSAFFWRDGHPIHETFGIPQAMKGFDLENYVFDIKAEIDDADRLKPSSLPFLDPSIVNSIYPDGTFGHKIMEPWALSDAVPGNIFHLANVAIATMLRNNVYTSTPKGILLPNIYYLGIGETSSGKDVEGSAFKAITSIMNHYRINDVQRDGSIKELDIARDPNLGARGSQEKLYEILCHIQSGCFMSMEAANLLGLDSSHYGYVGDMLLELFVHNPIYRFSYKTMDNRFVREPALNVILYTQPESIFSEASRRHIDSGLFPRFMIGFLPPEQVQPLFSGKNFDQGHFNELVDDTQSLLQTLAKQFQKKIIRGDGDHYLYDLTGANEKKYIRIDDGARKIFDEWMVAKKEALQKEASPILRKMCSKTLGELAFKCAMLVAFGKMPVESVGKDIPAITETVMEDSLKIMEHQLVCQRYFVERISGGDECASIIKASLADATPIEPLTLRQMIKKSSQLRQMDEPKRAETLYSMVRRGLVKKKSTARTDKYFLPE